MVCQKWIARGLSATALAAAMGSHALAQSVPSPAGAIYTFTNSAFCQLFGANEFGGYAVSTGYGAFGATSVQVNNAVIIGPYVQIEPLQQKTQSATYNWSNTASTITIGTITYNVTYNGLTANNQPITMWATGLDGSDCLHTFIAQVQPK